MEVLMGVLPVSLRIIYNKTQVRTFRSGIYIRQQLIDAVLHEAGE